jgi:hypothetical protein
VNIFLNGYNSSFIMLLKLFALAASVAAKEVSVVWRHEKPSASTSLTVFPATGMDTVLAEACGNTLGSLDFSRVDENGAGNFTVGDDVFDVFSEPTEGMPRCTRVYNDMIAIVECTGVFFDVPVGVTETGDCFTVEHAKQSFERLKTRSMDVLNTTQHVERSAEETEEPSRLSRILGGAMSRIAGQKRACGSGKSMERIGDGNPHQNYLHKQLSVSQQPKLYLQCNGSCLPPLHLGKHGLWSGSHMRYRCINDRVLLNWVFDGNFSR